MEAFQRRRFAPCGVVFCVVVIAIFNCPDRVQARAVNISNTWILPQEGFPVFYRYFRDRISWYEADAVCQFHHANLVTVDTTAQYDAARAYLKELDIMSNVWIGLIKSNEEGGFSWTDYKPLTGEGYWGAAPSDGRAPLCAALDPARDYRWDALSCGGPQVASFICELPVPTWAVSETGGCLVRSLPSLTVQFLPELAAVQLVSDCGLDGTKKVTCKPNEDHKDILKELSCVISDEDFSDNTVSSAPAEIVAIGVSSGSTRAASGSWPWSASTPAGDFTSTRQRRETIPTSTPIPATAITGTLGYSALIKQAMKSQLIENAQTPETVTAFKDLTPADKPSDIVPVSENPKKATATSTSVPVYSIHVFKKEKLLVTKPKTTDPSSDEVDEPKIKVVDIVPVNNNSKKTSVTTVLPIEEATVPKLKKEGIIVLQKEVLVSETNAKIEPKVIEEHINKNEGITVTGSKTAGPKSIGEEAIHAFRKEKVFVTRPKTIDHIDGSVDEHKPKEKEPHVDIFTQATDHFIPPLVMAKSKMGTDMTVVSPETKHSHHVLVHHTPNSMKHRDHDDITVHSINEGKVIAVSTPKILTEPIAVSMPSVISTDRAKATVELAVPDLPKVLTKSIDFEKIITSTVGATGKLATEQSEILTTSSPVGEKDGIDYSVKDIKYRKPSKGKKYDKMKEDKKKSGKDIPTEIIATTTQTTHKVVEVTLPNMRGSQAPIAVIEITTMLQTPSPTAKEVSTTTLHEILTTTAPKLSALNASSGPQILIDPNIMKLNKDGVFNNDSEEIQHKTNQSDITTTYENLLQKDNVKKIVLDDKIDLSTKPLPAKIIQVSSSKNPEEGTTDHTPDPLPRPNRSRILAHPPQHRAFYPYFFNRVLG